MKITVVHENEFVLKKLVYLFRLYKPNIEFVANQTLEFFEDDREVLYLVHVSVENIQQFKQNQVLTFGIKNGDIRLNWTLDDIFQMIEKHYLEITLQTEIVEKNERVLAVKPKQKVLKNSANQIVDNLHTIAIVGIRGNVGTSTLAQSLCQFLSHFGSVFYLNVLPLQNHLILDDDEQISIANLLVSINREQQINLKDYVVQSDNIFQFWQSKDPFDYEAVTNNYLEILISEIQRQLECQFIVIDWQLQRYVMMKTIFEQANGCLFINDNDDIIQAKSYVTHMVMSQQMKIPKCLFVQNKTIDAYKGYDVFVPKFQKNVNLNLESIWQEVLQQLGE